MGRTRFSRDAAIFFHISLQSLIGAAHPHPQVSDCLLAGPVRALHTNDVVSRLGEDMRGGGCAIAEGPNLLAIRGAEGPDLEGDRLSWSDARRGPVRGLNRRWHLLRMVRIEDIDCLEVVSRASMVV